MSQVCVNLGYDGFHYDVNLGYNVKSENAIPRTIVQKKN